jgi:hypothetical protein
MNEYSTQIRMPEALNDRLTALSNETGISKNSVMLMLMQLGLKLYNAPQVQVFTYPGPPDVR